MHDEIRVHVINKAGRRNLYLKAMRGRAFVGEKSARTAVRRKADGAAAVWQRELNDAENPNRGRAMSWDDFRSRYTASREGRVAESTMVNDEGTFAAFEKIVGKVRPNEIRTEHVDQFVATLRDARKRPATIDRHLRHLRAALRWGHRRRIVREVPVFELHGGQTAKGRPVTAEEFDRMLEAAASVVGDENAPSWRFLLRGLWTTGLRLGEAVGLHWTDERAIRIDETGRHPAFVFPPDRQKNRKADVVPCTPEFVDLVADAPREGFVFNPHPLRGSRRLTTEQTGRVVSRIGKAARIIVKPARDDDSDPTFASAHDLRRSFCSRLSRLVTPAVLMKLARHSTITTTMAFYVGHDADAIGDAVFDAMRPVVGTVVDSEAEPQSVEST